MRNDFTGAGVLVKTFGNWQEQSDIAWYAAGPAYKRSAELFEVVGHIDVHLEYPFDASDGSFFSPWSQVPAAVDAQLAYEATAGPPTAVPITRYTQRKRWWRR